MYRYVDNIRNLSRWGAHFPFWVWLVRRYQNRKWIKRMQIMEWLNLNIVIKYWIDKKKDRENGEKPRLFGRFHWKFVSYKYNRKSNLLTSNPKKMMYPTDYRVENRNQRFSTIIYLKRLLNVRQMDLEYTYSQLVNLIFNPTHVYALLWSSNDRFILA